MPTRRNAPASLLMLLAAFALAVLPAALSAEDRRPLKIGDEPPRFALSDLEGRTVNLPDDGRGRIAVVHFWADWCPYCLEEMPAIEKLYQQYKGKGLIIYAVNVGQTPDAAKAFVQRVKVTYPVLLDRDGSTAKRYDVKGLPRTFFLDKQGRIRYKLLGDASQETLNNLIKKML